MKKIWVGLWFVLQVTSLWSLDITNGQAQVGSVVGTVTDNNVTANLITGPLSSVVSATAPGGYSGGSTTGYNASTNTYYFGWTNQTIAKTIAINNALQGSGIQVTGVQYGMSYLNGIDSYGSLSMNVNITSNTGTSLQSYNHSFNTRNNAWQQFDQTQTFTNPYTLANLGNASMAITGRDSRGWAGYYGPQVKDPYLKLTYGSDPKTYYNIPDDGWVPVALPFTFPFYGRNFTSSFMYSNGVVGFYDPVNSFCCDGVNLANSPDSAWHWAIYGLQTDLIQANANAKFYTQTNGSSYMKYGWQNINEYGTQNLNTFDITIKPTGYIGIKHDAINVQYHNVTTGIAGDVLAGQYSQYYNGPGSTFPYTAGNVITFTGTENNACIINPTSSPSCPGYTAAMCSANPLFDSSCPGYATAVFNQQCNANQLSNQQCPGYAAAYLNLQCSSNPLYSTTCQGYQTAVDECSTNPLSHSYCTNYQTASQQCSVNPLYGSYCPGYATADSECSANPLSHSYCTNYQTATTECSANPLYASYCPGYQAAQTTCSTNPLSNNLCTGYSTASTECSSNPLSHNYCPGYQTATQQCSASALYASYCPGYAFAYACQQDGLYSNQCPNYAEAYAKKYVLNVTPTTTTTTTETTTTTASTTTTTTAPATTTEAITTQLSSGITDTTVSTVVTTKTTSTNTDTQPAAAVKLTAPAPAPSSPVAPQQVAQNETKKEEAKKEEKKEEGNKSNGSSNTVNSASDSSKPSDQPKSNREALAERRREAAQKEAVAKGANLANEMGKAADMEAQKQVQNVVIQAMGFTPGFDTYNKAMLPDGIGYRPFTVYGGQVNVDNKFVSRRLMSGSDKLHQDMVDSQYNRGN